MRLLVRRKSTSSSLSEWESCHDCSWDSDSDDLPEATLLNEQLDTTPPTLRSVQESIRFTKIRSQVRSSASSSFLRHDDRSSVPSKSSSARSSSLPSVTSIYSRSSSFYTPPSQQRYEAATELEQHTKPLEEYNTPEIRRLADGKFSIKVKLALVGLKLYAWLQRKAGWDEVDPPVQVYKDGKLLKPEDWSPELKEKYGYSVI